jgi:hypothetical protein
MPAVLAALFCMALLAGPAAADSGLPAGATYVGGGRPDLFQARVPVDVTAGSVTEAREKAFTDGRIAALQVVMRRLVSQADVARLPQPPANDVINMALEFSLANEHTSAVRYLADMTVRFNANAVRNLLRAAHIPFTEAVSRPMVVLPLYAESAGAPTQMWQAGNPWRDAFAHLRDADGLVPLILPAGDAEDAHLTLEQVQNRDATALGTLAGRYDAGGVVIAKAVGGAPGVPVQLTITQVRGIAPPTDIVASSAGAGATRDEVLGAAAAAVLDAVGDAWKREGRVDAAHDASQVTVLATITQLKDWLTISTALHSIALVDRVDLQALTRDRAQVSVNYRGEPDKFGASLAQQGLTGTLQDGVWIVALPSHVQVTQ